MFADASLPTTSRTYSFESSQIPVQYRLPEGQVHTVFRGDYVRCEADGIQPKLFGLTENPFLGSTDLEFINRVFFSLGGYELGQREELMFRALAEALIAVDRNAVMRICKSMVESGDPDLIDWLIDRHTDACRWSPFVSSTLNPQIAQLYATCDERVRDQEKQTVFELTISSDRAIIDAANIGGCGASLEVLVFGEIARGEISRVKSDNTIPHSELLVGNWLLTHPDVNGPCRLPRLPDLWRSVE